MLDRYRTLQQSVERIIFNSRKIYTHKKKKRKREKSWKEKKERYPRDLNMGEEITLAIVEC